MTPHDLSRPKVTYQTAFNQRDFHSTPESERTIILFIYLFNL